MLIMSVTVLPLSVHYVAPQKSAGVCLQEWYHFQGTEWGGGAGGLLDEELILSALRILPPHFS